VRGKRSGKWEERGRGMRGKRKGDERTEEGK
jgi:hypothetical protein